MLSFRFFSSKICYVLVSCSDLLYLGTITHSPIGSYVHTKRYKMTFFVLLLFEFHNTVESPCISLLWKRGGGRGEGRGGLKHNDDALNIITLPASGVVGFFGRYHLALFFRHSIFSIISFLCSTYHSFSVIESGPLKRHEKVEFFQYYFFMLLFFTSVVNDLENLISISVNFGCHFLTSFLT